MKIFLGLSEIAGYYSRLKAGFDQYGVEAVFVSLVDHPFEYSQSVNQNLFILLAKSVTQKYIQINKKNLPLKLFWFLINMIARIPLFLWAIFSFDVFIFSSTNSFFWQYFDLKILKFLKKRVIFVFHGSDSRPAYIDGSLMKNIRSFHQCAKYVKKQKKMIKQIERYANHIICLDFSSHLFSREIISFLSIGIPVTTFDFNPIAKLSTQTRILHAPSNPEIKGSKHIRESIARLKNKGYCIEYIEITNLSNADVLNELARCDFIVDQLYSDTPMAGFAAEAACYGKPAIVGGYAWIDNNIEGLPPSCRCSPDDLDKTVERLFNDIQYRIELGMHAKNYVIENWSSLNVAKKFISIINDRIPESWKFDPKTLRYIYGCGIEKNVIKNLVRNIVEFYGVKALQLSDKPALEKFFLQLAYPEFNNAR